MIGEGTKVCIEVVAGSRNREPKDIFEVGDLSGGSLLIVKEENDKRSRFGGMERSRRVGCVNFLIKLLINFYLN